MGRLELYIIPFHHFVRLIWVKFVCQTKTLNAPTF